MTEMKLELGVNVGHFAPDGSVEQAVTHCAFTGRYISGVHSNRERVPDSSYFYRVDANALHLVTDEWRTTFASAVKAQFVKSGAAPTGAPKSERSRKPVVAESQSEEESNDRL